MNLLLACLQKYNIHKTVSCSGCLRRAAAAAAHRGVQGGFDNSLWMYKQIEPTVQRHFQFAHNLLKVGPGSPTAQLTSTEVWFTWIVKIWISFYAKMLTSDTNEDVSVNLFH